MAISRVVVLLLGALAAPSQGSRDEKAHKTGARLTESNQTGAWLTESCQDYPGGSFEVGQPVLISRPGKPDDKYVGIVACQDPESPGKICLEGRDGSYEPGDLRPVGPLAFSFHALSQAADQIFVAIEYESKDAWEDLKLSLSEFGGFVRDKITDARDQIAEKLDDELCDADKVETAKQLFEMAAVRTKSLLVTIVDSAVEHGANVMKGIESVAATTEAMLVKIANHLSENVSEFYDANLKDIVDALRLYLGTIAAAVVNVPDLLNPLTSEKARYDIRYAQLTPEHKKESPGFELSALIKAIKGFIDGVGNLVAKLVGFSRDVYETVAASLDVLMSSTGRLIAAAASLHPRVKDFVKQLASDAESKMQGWVVQAAEFAKTACKSHLTELAGTLWASVQKGFRKAMDAVHRGHTFVKQSLSDLADRLAATVAVAAITIKNKSKEMWESPVVQSTLGKIKEEIQALKDFIVSSLGLVDKFVGGVVTYGGRFVPDMVKGPVSAKFKETVNKVKEMAKKIQEDIAKLVRQFTPAGESMDIKLDPDAVAVEL